MNKKQLASYKLTYMSISLPQERIEKQWDNLLFQLPKQEGILENKLFRFTFTFVTLGIIVAILIFYFSPNAKLTNAFYALKICAKSISQKLVNIFTPENTSTTGDIKQTAIISPTLIVTPSKKITTEASKHSNNQNSSEVNTTSPQVKGASIQNTNKGNSNHENSLSGNSNYAESKGNNSENNRKSNSQKH